MLQCLLYKKIRHSAGPRYASVKLNLALYVIFLIRIAIAHVAEASYV